MAKRVVFIFEDLEDAGSEEPHAHGNHGGARVGKLSLLSEDPVRGGGGGVGRGGGEGGGGGRWRWRWRWLSSAVFPIRSTIPL